LVFPSVCVVELAHLDGMSKPLIAKRLKFVKRQPFIKEIDRHALSKLIDIPRANR